MAKTLEVLRKELGWAAGKVIAGTATGGSTSTVEDSGEFAKFAKDDELKGVLVYLPSLDEALWATGYTASAKRITVGGTFSQTASGKAYEVYRAGLQLGQWTQAVNEAIRGAWAAVFLPEFVTWAVGVGGEDEHDLSALSGDVEDVAAVMVQDTNISNRWQLVPEGGWWFEPVTQKVYYSRKLAEGVNVQCCVMDRYPELAATESTDLDAEYILAAARGVVFGMLARDAGVTNESGGYSAEMVHWQKVAKEWKDELHEALMRMIRRRAGG